MKTTRTLSLALALLLPAVASAAPNEGVMTYSGYLHNSGGSPETGAQSLTFTLYDGPSTGNAVWAQTVTGVQPDAQGWFSVVLGAFPASFPPGEFLNQTWLGIKVGTEAEMAPRTTMGAAPHALSVDYSGLSGCTSPNQVLQWSGTAWACIATPTGGGGGGVTSIIPATGTPITVSGTSAVTLAMSPSSATANGFLLSADWNTFNAKAPTASPTFTGTVTAPTFAGSLSGNATSATTAGSATTATTATTANAVAANAVTPSDLNTGTGPTAGQVPARGTTDTFTWVTPLAAPSAACGPGQVLTWTAAGFGCVTDANTAYTAGAGLTEAGTQFAANFTVSGGTNGTATTVARGDHSHTFVQTVPLSDLNPGGGATLGPATIAYWVVPKAIVVTAAASSQAAVVGSGPMPVSRSPTLRLTLHNPTAATVAYTFNFFSSGVAAGSPPPDSRWTLATPSISIAAGGTGVLQTQLIATVVTAACASAGTCPMAAAGDLIWFSFGATPSTYNVLGVQLLF